MGCKKKWTPQRARAKLETLGRAGNDKPARSFAFGGAGSAAIEWGAADTAPHLTGSEERPVSVVQISEVRG